MVSVIRDTVVEERPKTAGGGLWKFALVFLILVSLVFGFIFAPDFGIRSWVVFGAMAILGIVFLIISLTRTFDASGAPVSIPISTALERVFARSPHAGAIIENGRVVRANDSYLELVDRLGIDQGETDPPLPAKLFDQLSEDAKAAVFRLSNMDEMDAFVEEKVEFWTEDEGLLRFLLRVTAFQGQRVWEILDFTHDAKSDPELLAKAPIGLMAVAEDGELISANDVILDWIGISSLQGMSFRDVVEHPDGILGAPKEAKRTIRFDTRLMTQKNSATPVVLIGSWSPHASGRMIASLAFHGHSSVSYAQAGSAAIGGAGADVSALSPVAALDAPFATVDIDSSDFKSAKVVRGNNAFIKLLGATDCEGRALTDIFTPIGMGMSLFDIDPETFLPDQSVDVQIKGRDGRFVSVYPKTDPASGRCRLYLVDISARKVLEDQLAQSQKMQAIGRLVAEIAHDFNNLLAAIRLYTDTLLGRHPIGDPSYPELQQINANVNRAASLVKKLLGYSRKQTIRAENLDVSETLSDMAVTLKQVLGEKVKLDIKHGRNLSPIRVDKNQFDTVLMNLAVNARDAMKGQGGGTITIQSQMIAKASIENPGLKASLEVIESDNVVKISVTDTGTGMTDEVKAKIFEPFFTTKGQGEGTGLGLATVYGIVQQTGGYLAVDSELGVGTTFAVYLPEGSTLPEAEAAKSLKPAPPAVKAPSDLAGSGTILFVEDEASVRIIAAKTLRKRGYTVIEACDGEEAYELIEDAETPFDLMISDVVMPGMDGPTLLKKARPQLKQTRIVFISGYAEEEFSELLAEEPDVTFLPKPFTLVQLAEKVKQQIGEVA